ncbi:MAG: hypothetical protein ABIT71_10725 [Vicinamibacteraceae bacterium]
MRIELKATLGGAWLIGLGALALSEVVSTGASRTLVFGFGLVPVLIMGMFWTPPEASLLRQINPARQ